MIPLYCPNPACRRYLGEAPGEMRAAPCSCGMQVERLADGTLRTLREPRPAKPWRQRYTEVQSKR